MAQRWRDDENREYGGNQRPRTWDQREQAQREQGGWQGEGGGWQGRGDEEYERWGRGATSGPGGEQQHGFYGREGDEVRHGGNPGRSYAEMGPDRDWRGNQPAYYGEEGGGVGRDMPYSHGGYGHRQRRGMGGSGQSGYQSGGYGQSGYDQGGYGYGGYAAGGYGGAGGYGYERDWQRDPAEHGRQYGPGDYAQRDYAQGSETMRSHRGKGPKGYERSAERLKEDICERLTDAPDVDASEISITCKDGIVTLEGTVDSRQMKHRAEDIAESCSGVKDVENRLKVQGQGERRADQSGGPSAGQSGVSNQNRLTTGGPLHH